MNGKEVLEVLTKVAQDVNGNGPEYGRAMLANQTPPTPGQERMRNDFGFLRDTARGGWRSVRQQVRGGMQAAAQGVRNAAANAYVGVNKATGGGLSRAVGAMYPTPKQQAAPATAPAQASTPAATNSTVTSTNNVTSANSTRPEGVPNPIIKAAAWAGFVDACRLEGVDPEQLIKAAYYDNEDDKPGFARRTVGGGIKGSLAGAVVGGAYGAGNAALNLRRLSKSPVASKMLNLPTSDAKEMFKLYLKQMLSGASKAAPAGAQWGGLIGAATGAAR